MWNGHCRLEGAGQRARCIAPSVLRGLLPSSRHESSALDASSSCSADVGRAIQSKICPIHGDEGWITARCATSSSTSEASDHVTVLSNTALGVANGSINRSGKILLVLRQERSEDNADDGDGCSEDEYVRSEGHDEYWRRHYGDFVVRVLSCSDLIECFWYTIVCNLVQVIRNLFLLLAELRCLEAVKIAQEREKRLPLVFSWTSDLAEAFSFGYKKRPK